jgi:hypothetical protein
MLNINKIRNHITQEHIICEVVKDFGSPGLALGPGEPHNCA